MKRTFNHYLAIIIVVVTLCSVIIVSIVVLSLRSLYEIRSMRELKAAGLQNFEKGNVEGINPDVPLGQQADLLPYDSKYEFPKEQLKLGSTLGSGEYGVVLKAIAQRILSDEEESTVAVKMIKRSSDNEVGVFHLKSYQKITQCRDKSFIPNEYR